MAKSLGIKLFTGYRAVNRFFKGLDLTLHEACDAHFYRRQNEESPQLPEWLYECFRFVQAEVGIPTQVTINPLPDYRETSDGDLKPLPCFTTTRMPNDGGGQERSLAGQYRADAKASSLLWPRTRAVLDDRLLVGEERPDADEIKGWPWLRRLHWSVGWKDVRAAMKKREDGFEKMFLTTAPPLQNQTPRRQ